MGFNSSTENSYSMPHAGMWEATAANGVAGVRRASPDVKIVGKGIRDGILSRRREVRIQRETKKDDDGWEAWTMTARGVINIHPLQIDVFAKRVGPIKPVGRNAIAVALAEDIVLVQFGDEIHDNDDDGDRVVKRRTPHPRLAGRSKSG